MAQLFSPRLLTNTLNGSCILYCWGICEFGLLINFVCCPFFLIGNQIALLWPHHKGLKGRELFHQKTPSFQLPKNNHHLASSGMETRCLFFYGNICQGLKILAQKAGRSIEHIVSKNTWFHQKNQHQWNISAGRMDPWEKTFWGTKGSWFHTAVDCLQEWLGAAFARVKRETCTVVVTFSVFRFFKLAESTEVIQCYSPLWTLLVEETKKAAEQKQKSGWTTIRFHSIQLGWIWYLYR